MITLLAPAKTMASLDTPRHPSVDAGEHVGLARCIARQFRHQGSACGFDLDDLTGEASVALVHASRSFVPARGTPFKAYGGRVIRNYLINLLNRRRLPTITLAMGHDGLCFDLPAPPEPTNDACDDVAGLLRVLPGRERLAVELRFGLGCEETSITAIADVLEVSRQRVEQIIERALERMRDAAEREQKREETMRRARRQLAPPVLRA